MAAGVACSYRFLSSVLQRVSSINTRERRHYSGAATPDLAKLFQFWPPFPSLTETKTFGHLPPQDQTCANGHFGTTDHPTGSWDQPIVRAKHAGFRQSTPSGKQMLSPAWSGTDTDAWDADATRFLRLTSEEHATLETLTADGAKVPEERVEDPAVQRRARQKLGCSVQRTVKAGSQGTLMRRSSRSCHGRLCAGLDLTTALHWACTGAAPAIRNAAAGRYHRAQADPHHTGANHLLVRTLLKWAFFFFFCGGGGELAYTWPIQH